MDLYDSAIAVQIPSIPFYRLISVNQIHNSSILPLLAFEKPCTFTAMEKSNVVLIIQDGWGATTEPAVSAIAAANTPFHDESVTTRPHSTMEASGLAVGLPEGQMGNSEVGHMNIGAGRIVYQDLVKINLSIDSGEITDMDAYKKLVAYCQENNKPLHLLGLLSDGGVHSSIQQLSGLLGLLSTSGIPDVYLHVFTDGRDTSPTGGVEFIRQIQDRMAETKTGKVASIIGRYFSMDRDKRWERVAKSYNLLVHGQGTPSTDAIASVQASYDAGVTDEFIEPIVMTQENGEPVATIQDGDAVLFYNYRTDRGRELTEVLTQEDMPDHGMKTLDLFYTTMTRYDHSFEGIHVVFEKDDIKNGLGEILANHGKTQIRIAETEKYPHVTFFFNGGREKPMAGEQHMMCPSPKVATYDLQPEMSAADLRDKILPEIEAKNPNFVCLNFANPDMVGHTGVFEAAVKAVETVDACTQAVVDAALANDYIVLVTADHGNADKMKNPDGSPHTAHTTALVPLILYDQKNRYNLIQKTGKLGDLAPTILTMMGIDIPAEMTGDILVEPIHADKV